MNGFIFDGNVAKKLNELCREEMKLELLKDILRDIVVCRLEGWDAMEYLSDLQKLVTNIINKKNHE